MWVTFSGSMFVSETLVVASTWRQGGAARWHGRLGVEFWLIFEEGFWLMFVSGTLVVARCMAPRWCSKVACKTWGWVLVDIWGRVLAWWWWLVVKVCGARKCTLEVHEELHIGGGGDVAWRTLLAHGGWHRVCMAWGEAWWRMVAALEVVEVQLGGARWLPWKWWRCSLVVHGGCLGSGGTRHNLVLNERGERWRCWVKGVKGKMELKTF